MSDRRQAEHQTPRETIRAALLSWKYRFGPRCAAVNQPVTDAGGRVVRFIRFTEADVDEALALVDRLVTQPSPPETPGWTDPQAWR